MLRDLKELRWRRKGPPLPSSVLEAAKLKIDPEGQGRWKLPAAYRSFLSQMDGGRPGRGAFRADGKTFVIEGFYAFADAANMAEKMRKGGKLPEGILPVAFTANDKPIVFLELVERGKVYLKANPRKFEEGADALSRDFAEFLNLLGDVEQGAAPATATVDPWTAAALAPRAAAAAPKPKPKPAPAPKAAPAKKASAKPAAKKARAAKSAKPAAKKATKKAAAKPATKKKAAKKTAAPKAAKKRAKAAKTAKAAGKKKSAGKKTTTASARKKPAAKRR